MKRLTAIFLLLLLAVPTAFADKKGDKQKKDPYQQLVGEWRGLVKIGSRRMMLVLHVSMGDNRLIATVDSPTQAVEQLPAEIQYAQGVVAFVMPRLDARFQGRVFSDFTRIEGKFEQRGELAYLTLKHYAESEPPKSIINDEPDKPTVTTDFLGDWAGDLKTGDKTIRFILHIRRNREGTVATVDSPDQDTFGIEVPTIASEDTKLSFNIPSLKLSYEGVVDAYRSNISGTLTQDGKPRPLNLTKS